MWIATLGANCTLEGPAAERRRLRRLAIVRRRGRLAPGQARWVRAFAETRSQLVLPIGLWPVVQRRLGAPRVIDRRHLGRPVAFQWRGRLYAWQRGPTQRCWEQGGGVLVAPPGAGKTVMGWACAAAWGRATLWLVHTQDLARQARQQAVRLTGIPPAHIVTVGAGEDGSTVPAAIYIGMVQTLARHPEQVARLAQHVGTVIVDEAHHCPADTVRRILVRLPARYKLGLSATPERTDGLGPLMRALLGPPVVVPLSALVPHRLVLPRVIRVPTPFRAPRGLPWARLDRLRAHDPVRQRGVARLIVRAFRAGRRCLVLVHRVDHARALAALLQAAGVPALAVVGAVPPAVRDQAYQALAAGSAVVVATQLADEGLDVPEADTLILAAPGRSLVRLAQQVGRVMRTAPGKTDAWVLDVMDTHVPVLHYHARIRAWWYRQWAIPVTDWTPPAAWWAPGGQPPVDDHRPAPVLS